VTADARLPLREQASSSKDKHFKPQVPAAQPPVVDSSGKQFPSPSVDGGLSFFATTNLEGDTSRQTLSSKAKELSKAYEKSRKRPVPRDAAAALSLQVQRFTYGLLNKLAKVKQCENGDGGLLDFISSHLTTRDGGVRGSGQFTKYLDILLVLAGLRDRLSANHNELPNF
jgi:hypothetical protein